MVSKLLSLSGLLEMHSLLPHGTDHGQSEAFSEKQQVPEKDLGMDAATLESEWSTSLAQASCV